MRRGRRRPRVRRVLISPSAVAVVGGGAVAARRLLIGCAPGSVQVIRGRRLSGVTRAERRRRRHSAVHRRFPAPCPAGRTGCAGDAGRTTGPIASVAPVGLDQFEPPGLQFGGAQRQPAHQRGNIERPLRRSQRSLDGDAIFRPAPGSARWPPAGPTSVMRASIGDGVEVEHAVKRQARRRAAPATSRWRGEFARRRWSPRHRLAAPPAGRCPLRRSPRPASSARRSHPLRSAARIAASNAAVSMPAKCAVVESDRAAAVQRADQALGAPSEAVALQFHRQRAVDRVPPDSAPSSPPAFGAGKFDAALRATPRASCRNASSPARRPPARPPSRSRQRDLRRLEAARRP